MPRNDSGLNKARNHVGRIVATALVLGLPVVALAQTDPGFNAPGFQKNRDYLHDLSFEHVDVFSGNVILSFTDLSLPGNAGVDLTWTRVHNSKLQGGWTFGIPGV